MPPPSAATPPQLTRRAALAGASALAFAAPLSWFTAAAAPASETPSLDHFMAASERITGERSLDPEFGRALYALLGPTVPTTPEGLADLRAAWYGGRLEKDGAQAYTYLDALCWRAAPFTKPAGWCGGVTGYWAEPPEA